MLTISKVKLEEIPEVKELLTHTWKDTYGKYYTEEQIEKITREWHNPEDLKAQALDSKNYFAAAKDEKGKIVGLITMRKVDDQSIFLDRIYVHPDSQGKNIGSKLLESAVNHFSSAEKLRAECEKKNNKACTFYLKRGFKIIEEKGNDVTFEKRIR